MISSTAARSTRNIAPVYPAISVRRANEGAGCASVPQRNDDQDHVGNILTKLRLRDRLQVAVAAYEAGLVRSWRGPPQVNVASAPRCME